MALGDGERLFVLHVSEDGDVTMRDIGTDLQAWLEREFGACELPSFVSELPRDLMSGTGGRYWLIRGRVVVPRAVVTAIKYEI